MKEVLGRGSYGKVYRADNDLTGKAVAIKTFTNTDKNKGLPKDSLLEANILCKTNHPNVLKAEKISLNGCSLCFATELANQNMSEMIANNVYPGEDEMEKIIFSLIDGLAYLHENYIVHQDIKEDNILMFGNVPKFADFGISSVKYQHTLPYENIITSWWRPPEIFAKLPTYNNTVDVWSLGVVLYNLLYNYSMKEIRRMSRVDTNPYFLFYCNGGEEWQIINQIIKKIGPLTDEMMQNLVSAIQEIFAELNLELQQKAA